MIDVRVRVPSPLRSYTQQADVVVSVPSSDPSSAPTLRAVLEALDVAYPGIRFRIIDEQDCLRPHVKLFVGRDLTRDLASPVPAGQPLMIVAALSGG